MYLRSELMGMAGALNKKEAKKRCAEFALRMIFVYEDVSHTVMFHTNMQGYKLGGKGKTYKLGGDRGQFPEKSKSR